MSSQALADLLLSPSPLDSSTITDINDTSSISPIRTDIPVTQAKIHDNLNPAAACLSPAISVSCSEVKIVLKNGTEKLEEKPPLLDYHQQRAQFQAVISRTESECNFGPVIPQRMYSRPKMAVEMDPHHNLYHMEEHLILLQPPIFFKSSEYPGQEGILLKDAHASRTKNLIDRDKPVLEGQPPSISICLEWPGYGRWSRQIVTRNFLCPPQQITWAKLTSSVAKCVQRFIQDCKATPMDAGSDVRWRIGNGPNDIKLEDLVLVSLHHVFLGCWQPHLALRRSLRPSSSELLTVNWRPRGSLSEKTRKSRHRRVMVEDPLCAPPVTSQWKDHSSVDTYQPCYGISK